MVRLQLFNVVSCLKNMAQIGTAATTGFRHVFCMNDHTHLNLNFFMDGVGIELGKWIALLVLHSFCFDGQ